VEAALAEPRCFPLKKKNRTASPHPKTALQRGTLRAVRSTSLRATQLALRRVWAPRQQEGWLVRWREVGAVAGS
jgi:hypothetical protein